MDNKEEFCVTKCIPDNGKRVMCYGFHTLCCSKDMNYERDWNEVTFNINMITFRLKKTIPDDPEESIFEEYKIKESWDCGSKFSDGRVIGVTKWRELDNNFFEKLWIKTQMLFLAFQINILKLKNEKNCRRK